MKTINHDVEFCVVGGGIAGLCAAVSAARRGAKTLLIQDRPVLGGNASSEIRMWICGSHGEDMREGGIVEEIILENYFQNPSLEYPLWDSVLYQTAIFQKNLTVLLNTSCLDAKTENDRIISVKAWQSNAELWHIVNAKIFADCSGDSILAPLTGASFRYGREGKSEFGEAISPDIPDKKTMGMSCLIQARETDSPKKYTPPSWANKYENDSDLPFRSHDLSTNFWWIELGGDGDALHDTDKYREELIKIAYGVWDHVKNHGDHGAENWELVWIGFLPGKRESRRYTGRYTVNQNDVESGGKFDDIVAYGGWSMDDHFPAGFNHKDSHPTIYHPAPPGWGIPFRALYSENISNLMFAGRNISATHAAMSSSRVMGTCGILGQAVGTAAALMLQNNQEPEDLGVEALQQALLFDDCWLPGKRRELPELTLTTPCNSEIIRNGEERGSANLWIGSRGDYLYYKNETPFYLKGVRLVFDSDFNRKYHNMPCAYPLKQEGYTIPATLIKDFNLEIIDKNGNVEIMEFTENRKRLLVVEIGKAVREIKFIPKAAWGCEEFRVFAFELF